VTVPPRPSDPIDREELEALVEALIEEARKRAQRRRRRNAAVLTLVTLVGVALFALVGWSGQSQTASPELSARMNAAAQAGTSRIAFISEPPSGGYCGTIYVMNPDGSGRRRLTNGGVPGCGGEHTPAWSPDGQKIAYVGDDVYVINADGSGQARLTSGPGLEWGPVWSPDGRAIAFTRSPPPWPGRGSEIWVMNADGSEQRMLAARDSDLADLAWSPLGVKIAFASRVDGNLEIYVMNADGSEQRRLTRNTVRDSNPVWSPNGRRIAFESNWQVGVMNADGSGQRRLTRNGARNFAPAWSHDGLRIAFERRLGRQQSGRCSGCGNALAFEVWVMNADGTRARMLARDGAQPFRSPDGQKIAFERQSDVYVMNADWSGQHNLTRAAGRRESQPIWSPAQK
jgi:Tol biopolymer transport system component